MWHFHVHCANVPVTFLVIIFLLCHYVGLRCDEALICSVKVYKMFLFCLHCRTPHICGSYVNIPFNCCTDILYNYIFGRATGFSLKLTTTLKSYLTRKYKNKYFIVFSCVVSIACPWKALKGFIRYTFKLVVLILKLPSFAAKLYGFFNFVTVIGLFENSTCIKVSII